MHAQPSSVAWLKTRKEFTAYIGADAPDLTKSTVIPSGRVESCERRRNSRSKDVTGRLIWFRTLLPLVEEGTQCIRRSVVSWRVAFASCPSGA